MLQKWLVKEMINIKYILISFATKPNLLECSTHLLMNTVKDKK